MIENFIQRSLISKITNSLKRGKSILLLGARQTGKTTLVQTIKYDRYINLMNPELRLRYENRNTNLIQEIKALSIKLNTKPIIIIDEIQKVPPITDSVQILIDENIASFILTGSSARKIKNLLPGRVIKYELHSLTIQELQTYSSDLHLKNLLLNGSLPGIITVNKPENIEEELTSYVALHLEEEIRKEALVRNLSAFSDFLRLACIESGNIINFRNISQEVGVAHTTISEYYRILKDCMIITEFLPLVKTNSRRILTKSSKYALFDLGVRRVGAKESFNRDVKHLSFLFEQFIGLELKKIIDLEQQKINVLFWRDHNGPEIDFVLEKQGIYTPVEVKWTKNPTEKDIKHIITFQKEYPVSKYGYIVCQTPYPMQLSDKIIAISWKNLNDIFQEI